MGVNRIQIQIFKKMGEDAGLETDEFLLRYSKQFLGRRVISLDELTEEEAAGWITKAYIQSLEEQKGK